jgi:general L-amino acid transport system substrate-binding protein
MAHNALALTGLTDADGGAICVPAGTSTETQVASYL